MGDPQHENRVPQADDRGPFSWNGRRFFLTHRLLNHSQLNAILHYRQNAAHPWRHRPSYSPQRRPRVHCPLSPLHGRQDGIAATGCEPSRGRLCYPASFISLAEGYHGL